MSSYYELFLVLTLFVLGTCIGSFLNVVIARVPAGQSIVRPGSRCPGCGYVLRWYDNVPLVSWLLLRARCRGCKKGISARYPLVEALTGALYLACYGRFGFSYELLPAIVLVSFLIPLVFIDAEHWILPFELTLPGIAAGVVLAIPAGRDPLIDALIGAAAGFLAFRAMEYVGWIFFRKEALGGGDKYLLALLCAFLTWRSLLGIIFLASLQGAVFGIARIALTGRAGPKLSPAENGESKEEEAEVPATMTWEFTKPGLRLWRRVVLLPVNLLFQPIPDEPEATEGAETEAADWVPGATNLPFGPWLALAGLEILLFAPLLTALLPGVSLLFFDVSASP